MIDRSHIDGVELRMPTPIPKPDDPKQVLDFYLAHFPAVEVVTCNKCHNIMCLWVDDPSTRAQSLSGHHQGWRRITLNPLHLIATRKREDGYIGYECDCGNDSRLARVEQGIIPVKTPDNPNANLEIMPHHIAAIRILLAQKGYQTEVKEIAGKRVIDGFIHERLK